jgi:histidinol phosphatase-like enzyme
MKTYVVDIDGTICTQSPDQKPDYSDSEPIQERISVMNDLYDNGDTIIYFTARGMGRSSGNQIASNVIFYERTLNQLSEWGVKFHSLYLGKPAGDVYIDDKGINANDFFRD